MKTQTYKAQWFRYSNGTYLKLDESFNTIAICEASNIEDAIENFKERENADSEIPFLDRVNVWPVVSKTFYRVKYKHFGFATEDYSTFELAEARAQKRINDFPIIYEITETGNPIALTSERLPSY